jgi:4-amino-4-deoxy-L-arabinose transferase-like glycosyltransferase
MNRASARLCLVTVIVCAVAIYVYPLALRTPLLDPDEGVHARIAQEMVERGDYVVPHFGGQPFRDKPFLYSAAQALSLRVFGMNEAAVRLPGCLFALLGSVTAVLLARRMFDAEAALYTALASLTLVLPAILAQAPAHDIALVPWISLIVLSFWEQEQCGDARKRWRWVAAMSVFIALAFLTKGIIGVAVVASGLGLYAIVSRTLSRSLVVRCSIALIAGGLLASPWYLAMEHASPGYLYYYFIDRHVLGFLTEGQDHGAAPWYYYVGPVIGGAMPSLLFATAAVLQTRLDSAKQGNRATLLLACWFIGGFLFLSVAGSKLVTYSLPLFAPIAVLAGVGFHRFFHAELSPIIRRLFVNTFRFASIAGVVSPVVVLLTLHKIFGASAPVPAYCVALLASIAMAIGLLLFERQHGRAALAIGTLWFPILFVCLMTWPVQTFAEVNSQRSFAAMLNASDKMPQQVVLYGQRVGSVLFYLSPENQKWCEAGRIREALVDELPALVPPPEDTIFAITNKELKRNKMVNEFRQFKPRVVGPFKVITGEPENIHVATKPSSANE